VESGASELLASPKFEGVLQANLLPAESVLLSSDFTVEVYEGSGDLCPYRGVAVVLTQARLLGFRGRGLFKAPPPFTIELKNIEEVAVTSSMKLQIPFKTSRRGVAGLWKMQFEDREGAYYWLNQIQAARAEL
jgi:hypothetical protein